MDVSGLTADSDMFRLNLGCPTPVFKGRRPVCLRCFPASAHLIHMNGLLTDVDAKLMVIHSFESGVLKQAKISDMQDSGPRGLESEKCSIRMCYCVTGISVPVCLRTISN